MTAQTIAAVGLAVLAVALFPIYKYFISKAQMTGWLHGLKQNKEESEHDEKTEK